MLFVIFLIQIYVAHHVRTAVLPAIRRSFLFIAVSVIVGDNLSLLTPSLKIAILRLLAVSFNELFQDRIFDFMNFSSQNSPDIGFPLTIPRQSWVILWFLFTRLVHVICILLYSFPSYEFTRFQLHNSLYFSSRQHTVVTSVITFFRPYSTLTFFFFIRGTKFLVLRFPQPQ